MYFRFIYISPNPKREDQLKQECDSVYKMDAFFWPLVRDGTIAIYLIWFVRNVHGPVTLLELTWFYLGTSGTILIITCHVQLNTFFTHNIGIFDNHELIKTGVYSVLMHPSYTGEMIVWFSGLRFFQVNYVMSFAILSTIFWHIQHKIAIEEMLMDIKFLVDYENYHKARFRFIPFLHYEGYGFVI